MGRLIEFKKEGNKELVIFKRNNKYLGDIIQEIDGDFVYYPETGGGAWAGGPMMEIAVHLILLNNSEWENEQEKASCT